MEINGAIYNFEGTLSLFAGDNFASQYIGGYKALSSALRKCRYCMAVDEDMQSKVSLECLSFVFYQINEFLVFIRIISITNKRNSCFPLFLSQWPIT